MKKYSYIISCILFFLVSCAEEGPLQLGKLEYDVNVTAVFPTIAFINVCYPQNSDNLFREGHYYQAAYLSKKSLNGNTQLSIDDSNWVKSSGLSDRENGKYVFTDLEPGTTYYLILENGIYFNDKTSWTESPYIYTGISFTTAQEGYYSGLSGLDFKFEFADNVSLRTSDNNYKLFSLIKLCLPYPYVKNLNRYDDYSNLQASLTQNMTDVIYGLPVQQRTFMDIEVDYGSMADLILNYCYRNNNEIYFIFPLLEKKKYYLKYDGIMDLGIIENSTQYYEMKFDNFSIDGSVDLSGI